MRKSEKKKEIKIEQSKEKKTKSKLKKVLLAVLVTCLAGAVLAFAMDIYVCGLGGRYIQSTAEAAGFEADCILVLGAGIRGDQPSLMLKDRLDTAIALYNSGASKKLVMSGDHGRDGHNEVGVMKTYAMEQGVPAADIFMDHAGFSTYESLVRIKRIFECERVVVVSQSYHLYRALYIGQGLGLTVAGVSADVQNYHGQFYRDVREIAARDKDFLTMIVRPAPKFLGEKISITGDGNVTNDDAFTVLAQSKNLYAE